MVSSLIKMAVGLVYMAASAVVHGLILLALTPSRNLRIRASNYWGWVSGRFCMWLSGSTVTIHGGEHFDGARPAIYISNHTSIHDIFIGIWQAPVGTVGVAKKEVVWLPFFGQLYWMSGHLRIDRGNHERAMASMRDLEDIVRRYRLSIWMWPEGTRARDGRLQPFKKGLYHLAVHTGLPVVPVIVRGAHLAWRKGSFVIRGVPIEVEALPAISTAGWADRDPDVCMEELHALFAQHLPPDQQPLTAGAAA
ncbi:MAG TPA: lysophospholipid acyltransferase family protein [Myxococcota bacterium]|nr:lysophospholipid acyltransferase family protein [Myxococcota bacterium]